MTTVASGRCTSAPGVRRDRHREEADRRDQRGGEHRPQHRDARSRRIASSARRRLRRAGAATSLAMTTPFSTATPATAMKPTAAGIENGSPRSISASDAADQRERHAGEHRDRVAQVAEHQEQHRRR